MLLRDATIDELIQMLLATEVSVGANAIETQLLRDELDRRKLRGTQNGTDLDDLDSDRQSSSLPRQRR